MLKPILVLVAVVVTVMGIVCGSALLWIHTDHFRLWLQSTLNAKIPGSVTIEHHRLWVLKPRVELEGVTLSDGRGDPVAGLYYLDLLEMYENDPETEAIVLIGEIGGDAEEQAAEYIAKHVSKPVVAFIAGQTAPPGKRMGHAGAIISSGSGTAEEKIKAFAAAGVPVAKEPSEIPGLLQKQLAKSVV